MPQSIHAHDVISLLAQHSGLTTEQLIAIIHQQYGANATFYTCAAEGLNADQLLQFMDAKGVLWDNGQGGWDVRPRPDAGF